MPTFIVKNNPHFAEPIQLQKDDEHHIQNVLRLRVNEEINLTDGKGLFCKALITHNQPLSFKIISVVTVPKPSPLIACVPLIDFERLCWLVEKLTELNIKKIELTIYERSQLQDLSPNKLAKLEKIALAALKQCGRAHEMIITPPKKILDKKFCDQCVYITALTNTETISLATVIQPTKPCFIFVGPEGGLTTKEIEFLKNHHSHFINLGNTILRSETAMLSLATLSQFHLQ